MTGDSANTQMVIRMQYVMRFLGVLLTVVLTACALPGAAPASALTPVFAFTETVVGPNRLPIGIIKDGSPVNDPNAQITLRFYQLDGDSSTAVGEAKATYYGQGLPAAVYVANFTFARAGNWGVEVVMQLSDMTTPTSAKLQLPVSERAIAPMVGDTAPRADTLTPQSVPDVVQLVSTSDPNLALYQTNLATALDEGRPIALLFATPGFCRTAVCGPSLAVFAALQQQFGSSITFIHSEIYRYPFGESFTQQNEIFSQAMREARALTDAERKIGVSDAYYAWGLQSEPWLFLINSQGVITARFEGGLTNEELAPILATLK